ncbi:MAG: phage tail assembly chaperone [Pseudomonadota bacterium]
MATRANSVIGFAQLQAIAAQQLGWRPEQFWAATPVELAMCLRPPSPSRDAKGCSQEDLTALMARFPDPCNEALAGASSCHD